MRLLLLPGVLSFVLSAPVGLCAGGLCAAAYLALRWTTGPGVAVGSWVVALTAPVLGGLAVALLQRLAPEVRGPGIPQAMAAAAPAGTVPGRVALLHPLTAGLGIAAGWPAGREGPAVFAGTAVGEVAWARARPLLRRARGPAPQRAEAMRVRLLAAGAAGGVAGAMNMPLAALLLVTALLLRHRARPGAVACTAVGSVCGALAHRLVAGSAPLAPAEVQVPPPLLLVVVIGVLAVPVATAYTASVRALTGLVDARWHAPEYLRPVAGGVVIGGLLLVVPQWAGTGELMLRPDGGVHALPAFLAVLVVGKILATALAAATLRSGGLIGPALFLGGAVGQLVAATATAADPAVAAGLGSCWVVGIAAVFAGASRLPLTAAASAVELTGSWSLALPALACALVAACGAAAVRGVPLFPGTGARERPAEE